MTINIPITTGPSKRSLIELAFDDCGMAGYVFERTPEEYTQGLRKLNAMMAEWPFNLTGYYQPDLADGDGQDESGIDPKYTQAVATCLAYRMAPGFGKTLSSELMAAKARSLAYLTSEVSTIANMAFPSGTLRGSGNNWRQYESPFINEGGPQPDPNVDPGNLAGIVQGG